MKGILEQLVAKVKEQIEEVDHLQKDIDFVKKSQMEPDEKFRTLEDCSKRLQEASNILRSLRQSLFAFRQAIGHSDIDSFRPEVF